MSASEQHLVHDHVNNITLDRRVLDVCDAVGQFIAYWGFKAINGRVWSVLVLSHQPLTQVQIARTLGVSRSLISGTITELSRLGLVRAVSDARNAPYEAVTDVWPAISDVLRSREWMLLEKTRVHLEAAIEEARLAGQRDEDTRWRADRMELLLSMTEVAQSFIRLILRVRGLPKPDGFGAWLQRARGLVDQARGRTRS